MGESHDGADTTLFERQREHLFFTWSAQRDVQPLTIVEAAGPRFRTLEDGWLWDLESQVYNVNVGHRHAHLQARMTAQIQELPAAAPNAALPIRAELGELLRRHTGLHRAFLTTGGSEATENAIKIARLVTGRSKIVTRRSSYHGATLAVLGVAGDARKEPYARHLAPAFHIDDPYPWTPETPSSWVRSLEALIEREGPETIAAVLLEGFTGTNGMQLPPQDFWPRARALCDAHGILLIDDEIFSGFGRTGRWFAHEHFLGGHTPDMMIVGKGLTSGYAPLAGVVVAEHVAAHFDTNKLWCGLTTYAHPVSCAAAVGSIEVLEREQLIANARDRGETLRARLTAMREAGLITSARGLGLMWLVELDRPAAPLHAKFRAQGAYVPFRGHNLFLCPPLCVTDSDINTIVDLLAAVLADAT